MTIKNHPFEPLITKNTKSLIVGTLPPETAPFYFSNHGNNRLWDLLYAIQNDLDKVASNCSRLEKVKKENILKSLGLGFIDIIQEYDRKDYNSVSDSDIIPYRYNNLIRFAKENNIKKLLFVYKSAAMWFLHSLENSNPKRYGSLKYEIDYGVFKIIDGIQCISLPNCLSRSHIKGETMEVKLKLYRDAIK